MRRFVVIATVKRGAVVPAEPLDGDGQARMFAAEGWSNAERLHRECVIWNDIFARRQGMGPRRAGMRESRASVERMMRLARVAG
jgi:hypothetical protein